VLDYFVRNREHLEPWSPPAPANFYTLDGWRARLSENRQELRDDCSLRLFLCSDGGEVLGSINFTRIARGPFQACCLGYSVDARREGQGLMHSALERACAYVFEELSLHRIEANYRPENTRSARLLQRLGFVAQGFSRDYLYIDGAWRDHVLTALTNPAQLTPV